MEKKHLIISALTAALLSTTASGFAQDRYRDGGRDNDRYSQRDRGDDRRSDDRRYDDRRGDDRRGDGYRNDGYQARGGGRIGNEGYGGDRRWDGAGPGHDLRRGNRLPERYRSHQYVVNNYREHHLRPPPRGYHWVQTGGDYVLAAIATGLIADLIINH